MIKPISEYIHFYITEKLKKYNIKTVLDIGGTGKMKNRGFKITSVNKRYGVDGTNLSYKDNTFDATVSIATLEHVGDYNDQVKFLEEAVRVSKKVSIHWFPINKYLDIFLKKLGHDHPCITPNELIIKEIFKSSITENLMTVKERLLLLATMKPKFNIPELYEYILKYGEEPYGEVLIIGKK